MIFHSIPHSSAHAFSLQSGLYSSVGGYPEEVGDALPGAQQAHEDNSQLSVRKVPWHFHVAAPAALFSDILGLSHYYCESLQVITCIQHNFALSDRIVNKGD